MLKRLVSGYWEALAGFRRRAAVIVLLLGFGGLFEAIALGALVPAIDSGGPRGRISRLLGGARATQHDIVVRALVLFAVFGLLAALANFATERKGYRLRFGLEASLRGRVTDAVLSMPWLDFLELRLGDIEKTALLDGMQTALGAERMARAAGLVLVTLVYFALALVISPILTLLAGSFGVIAIPLYRKMAGKATAHANELNRFADELTGELSTILSHQKYIRAAGLRARVQTRAQALYGEYSRTAVSANILSSIPRFVFDTFAIAMVGGFLGVSLLLTSRSIGASIVFVAVFYRLAPRVTTINEFLYYANVLLPWYESWKRVYDAARSKSDLGQAQPRSVLPTVSRVALQDVTFSYPGSPTPVLAGIGATVERGRCLAVVGLSGAGKTTLLDLLTGLLATTQGRVLVNDSPLDQLDQEWWRSRVGIVMQESPLFHLSIAENVALSVDQPDRERVQTCLELADAWDFVKDLPAGMDTDVGDKGARLSGGQRQRIALARALYGRPDLLLLDEATSALDSRSEAAILEAVRRVMSSCAVVMVSHRLNTVSFADEILVLDGGRVVERGGWDALAGGNGPFSRMLEHRDNGPEDIRSDAQPPPVTKA
ncbi:MAG: ABC transporter ATP-binding protein [Acidimicrobiales bacterium]